MPPGNTQVERRYIGARIGIDVRVIARDVTLLGQCTRSQRIPKRAYCQVGAVELFPVVPLPQPAGPIKKKRTKTEVEYLLLKARNPFGDMP